MLKAIPALLKSKKIPEFKHAFKQRWTVNRAALLYP